MYTQDQRRAAGQMLADLKKNRLRVVLRPGDCALFPDRKVRAVVSHNPQWYSDLCAAYPSARRVDRQKVDTIIRRANIMRTLQRIENGRGVIGVDGDRLRPFIDEWLEIDRGGDLPALYMRALALC